MVRIVSSLLLVVAIENTDVNDAIDDENCAFEFDQI